MNDQAGPPIVVFLVHGTQLLWWLEQGWARWQRGVGCCPSGTRALWPERGQPFRENLTRLLGPAARVYDLAWSGANSQSDRAAVTDRLIEELRRHPHARRFVVAHSHGGNIARAAALAGAPERLIHGLVCLSTPFFSARERPHPTSVGVRAALSVGLGLAVLALVGNLVAAAREWNLYWTFGLLAPGLVLCALAARLGANWLRRAVQQGDELCALIEGTPVPCPALLVHVAGDEAFRWLKMGEWVPVAVQYLVRAAERASGWWRSRGGIREFLRLGWLLGVSVASAIGAALVVWSDVDAGALPAGGFRLWGSAALLAALFAFSGLVTVPLFIALLLLTPQALLTLLEVPNFIAKLVAFGIPTWRYEVTTESAPLGTSTIALLRVGAGRPGLWHSQSYLHPEAVGVVATWILACAAAGGSAGNGPSALAEVAATAE